MFNVLGLMEGDGTFNARSRWGYHRIQKHHPVVRDAKVKSVGVDNGDITSDGKIKGVVMLMGGLLLMLGKWETVHEFDKVNSQ